MYIFVLYHCVCLISITLYKYIANTYYIQIGKCQAHIHKKKKNTYNSQRDLELILYSRQLLILRIIHSGCKKKRNL